MRRDPAKMAATRFDVLFIGGGITGATAAYDAAQRGLQTALVEKKDFGWATSNATSKLIHGGLRYLKNLEIGLVRESLRERRILTRLAPHLVAPLPFLVPTYQHSSNNRPMITAGMIAYELLSFDKTWLDDPDRQAPSFSLLSRQRVLELESGVHPDKLTGGAIYYDCQMHAPERISLEFLLGATDAGAQVANYTEVEGLLTDKKRIVGVRVRDKLSGETYEIHADQVVNVAGPWADFVSEMALAGAKKSLIRSQGIHLIFRPVIRDHAVVLQTKSKRHFFLIPLRGMTLAGTTDTRFEGHPDAYGVTRAAAQTFIEEINEVYPSAQLTMDDVVWTYGGLRPIVDTETDVEVEVYKASRKYEIYDHAKEDGLEGFVTVVGGKYTTSRHLAEQLVDLIEKKLGRPRTPCRTAQGTLPGGAIPSWRDFLAAGREAHPELGEAMLQRLSLVYGSRRQRLIDRMTGELAAPLDERQPLPAAVVIEAVECEMARTLEDVLWRRTTLADTGQFSVAGVEKAAGLMAPLLDWSPQRTAEEIASACLRLERKNLID